MNDFIAFANLMRLTESSGNYRAKNKFGFLGAYQFGKPRLYDLGYSIDGYAPKGKPQLIILSTETFLNDSFLQDKLFRIHVAKWKAYCITNYSEFLNLNIKGIKITLSGMVAALHLLGVGTDANPGLKQFLYYGTIGKDGNNTPITTYLTKFSGYEL